MKRGRDEKGEIAGTTGRVAEKKIRGSGKPPHKAQKSNEGLEIDKPNVRK